MNSVCAVSDNVVGNDTLSVNDQSAEVYSDTIEVSSDNNHIDEKIVNSSDVKIQDNNQKPSNVVKKASSTVKTTITAKDVTKYYQDGTTLKAYLKNSNGKALSGKKITVTYSGNTYSRTTDSKGCVSWDVKKGPGTYSVKFTFKASGYQSSSKTAKVTVKAMPTTLTANNLAFTYGDGNNKLKATLKDKNGKTITNKTVVFNFNGQNYNRKTDSKGVATMTIGAGPKKYTTTISFTNANYVKSTKTVTVTVNSIPTSLTVNDLTCNYDDSNTYLYATLKDTKNNKFLSGQTITFKINGKSINVVSDSNGKAGIKIEEKPGTYNVDVSFAKSPYASVSKKINLNVQGALTPEINIPGGFYNTSSLLVDFTGDNAEYIIYCSFDNGASWYKDNHDLSFNLTTGNWSITYYSSFRGFNSTINHVSAITILNSKSNIIRNNQFTNLNYGILINNSYEDVFFGNNFSKNNISLYLNCVDSKVISNTFIDSHYGIYSINASNLRINFNRIVDNSKFGVYCKNGIVDANNNWWGKNYITNKTLNSGDINSNENIRINCSAYLVLNVYETNYKIDNGIVYNVSYVANLKSNNYGEIFNQYFIPNCKIVYNMYCEYLYDNGVVYSDGNRIIDLMLSEGSSIKEYRLGFSNNLTVTLDHQNISFFRESSFNAYAIIDIVSSAIFNGSNLDIDVRVPLVDDVDWFSIVCRYVGNFKSELLLIYNGEVRNTIIIESSFYNEAKNVFSNNFWNALDTYHSCFSGYRNKQICAYAYLYLNDPSLNTIELLDNKLSKINIQFKLQDVYELLANNNITLNDILLNLIKNSYSLSDLDMSFINYANGNLFDTMSVSLKYPGNDRSFFAFEDNINKTFMWRGDSSVSLYNIHYVNGGYFDLTAPFPIGDNGDLIYDNGNIYSINYNCIYTFLSSDYDCLKTYTFANSKINNNTLNYWLNQKNRTDVNGELYYNIGYMKAAYGSFLEGLLVIYCNDVVADVSADMFNVSWTRVNPMVMSVCDSLEGYYLTGESDFNFGREVVGDVNNIKAFNFACSASFSIIEKYVIDALFPNEGNKSSAMFSLIDSLFNNGTLEFIVEGNYTLIHSLNVSNVVFVYDETTGILRDCINGCYGAYCYASQQTEWGHNFGENSLKLEDLIGNIINGIDTSLDNMNNDWLGLAGGLAITIGTGLFLASNPVGWSIAIGAGLLIGSGMLATYYADDLNKGWNYNKGAHFIFDVGTSMIPAGAPSSLIKWNVGRLGKIVLSDGHLVRHVTKNSVNKGFDKYLMNLAKSYGGTIDYGSHKIIRYGTIEAISNTMYGTTKKEFIEYSIQYCINKYIIGDIVINKIFSR